MTRAADDRARIIARIRALRAKTTANGCTEGEALAAAAKVAELLERYNLDLDEVDLEASPFARRQERHPDAVGDRLWKVADGIAVLTGARFWTSPTGISPVEISFFGLDHEVEVAAYLLDICAGAMRRAEVEMQRAFALLTPIRRRARTGQYLDGMADRLRERLIAMKPKTPAGRGLVVRRDQLIDAAMAAAGINLRNQKTRSSNALDPAYGLGRRAADRVALSTGLGGRAGGLALENRS